MTGVAPPRKEQALAAYRRHQVQTASPGQLIVIMYDACIGHCKAAQDAIEAGDRGSASSHLTKARGILAELMSSLDIDAGGEISGRLLRLYEYMYRQLVLASARKDAGLVAEVQALLGGLRGAWAEAAAQHPATVAGASASEQSGPTA